MPNRGDLRPNTDNSVVDGPRKRRRSVMSASPEPSCSGSSSGCSIFSCSERFIRQSTIDTIGSVGSDTLEERIASFLRQPDEMDPLDGFYRVLLVLALFLSLIFSALSSWILFAAALDMTGLSHSMLAVVDPYGSLDFGRRPHHARPVLPRKLVVEEKREESSLEIPTNEVIESLPDFPMMPPELQNVDRSRSFNVFDGSIPLNSRLPEIDGDSNRGHLRSGNSKEKHENSWRVADQLSFSSSEFQNGFNQYRPSLSHDVFDPVNPPIPWFPTQGSVHFGSSSGTAGKDSSGPQNVDRLPRVRYLKHWENNHYDRFQARKE
ncbi:hypothetical protein L596_015664 [Steinernema carpocapsae]|uniref:Uncharacterized protein n=1 Tax=Steinernema carpocapsae TaxID=34508 RepID=A0A4U5NFM3_STECR|nr:hypothetical protein L596_015664 [Steinernema carpocapsae]